MTRLLARYAECVYWLARYVERAENLARILDVQETFARDSRGAHDWGAVLAINDDVASFEGKHRERSAKNVLEFYLIDRDNPSSIVSDLHFARENARALRPLITTEMWIQLNVFYQKILALRPADISEQRLARLCSMIKEGCDAHAGITAGTFYRDEAWSFYRLGAAIECADETTRLLDAKFVSFGARADDAGSGSAADASYWVALLRSAAGYQAFRRRHPRGMNPEEVATFLLCDPCFPRSVVANLGIIQDQLSRLRRHYYLRHSAPALEQLDVLIELMDRNKLKAIVRNGDMHAFNDGLQRRFATLGNLLGTAFFWQSTTPAAHAAPSGEA